jgi:hypothetical protein
MIMAYAPFVICRHPLKREITMGSLTATTNCGIKSYRAMTDDPFGKPGLKLPPPRRNRGPVKSGFGIRGHGISREWPGRFSALARLSLENVRDRRCHSDDHAEDNVRSLRAVFANVTPRSIASPRRSNGCSRWAIQAGTLLQRPHIPALAENNVTKRFFEREQLDDGLWTRHEALERQTHQPTRVLPPKGTADQDVLEALENRL